MGPGMFDNLVYGVMVLLVLAPLGLWKLIEIIIWLCQHVRIAVD